MLETIGAIPTIIAIIGVVLNNYQNRTCFIVWLASNSMSAGIHMYAGIWSLAARDIVFLVLAVHGWMKWTHARGGLVREDRE